MVYTVYTLSMGTYWVRRVQVLTLSWPLRPFAWRGAVNKHLDQLHDVWPLDSTAVRSGHHADPKQCSEKRHGCGARAHCLVQPSQ